METRLRSLLRRGEDVVAAHLSSQPVPLQDGDLTTFVYLGEAEAVDLQHWIYGLEAAQPFDPVDGSRLWVLTVELPPGSRIEYKIGVTENGERRVILDPLNPRLAHDPFGANSVCHTTGYETPGWTEPDPEARPGSQETLVVASEALQSERAVEVYLPPRYRRSRTYPLLVVHDGDDYQRYSGLRTVLDNLIYRHEVAPLIVVLTNAADRLREYAADPAHARFLTFELTAALEERFPVATAAAARGLMGASFGAVAALATAWRHPGRWGRLLLQSGSFAFTDIGRSHRGPEFEPVVEFMNQFRAAPGRPSEKAYVSCGIYESLIYENRSLLPVLQATGMQVLYAEARDGHNWENWRDRVRQGLSFLFPGPLWMVYE